MRTRLPFQSELKPIRKLRIVAFAFQIISIALSLIQPLLIGSLLDKINAAAAGAPFEPITRLALLLVGVSLLDFLVYYFKDFYFGKVVASATNLMREHTLSMVLKRPATLFKDAEKGDVMNRILNDSDLYAQYAVSELPQFSIILIRVIAIAVILLRMNLLLTGTAAGLFLIYLFLYLFINKKIRPRIHTERERYSDVLNRTQETLDGFSTIKVNGQESFFTKRFSGVLQQYLSSKIRVQGFSSLGNGLLNFFYAIIPIAVLAVGAHLVVTQQITIGTMIAFYSYTHWIIEPVYTLSDLNRLRQQALAILPRLKSFLDSKLEEEPPQRVLPTITAIELDHIAYWYQEEHPLFVDLSLQLKRGLRVAITGASGIGKTSLAELLLGLTHPTSGEIRVDGIPLNTLNHAEYLQHCAYLPQSVFLFAASLTQNISFLDQPAAWLEEIVQNCHLQNLAHRTEFNAQGLSGGERQRIGLARAFYRRPTILICDEPTAALDEATEQLVIQSLDAYTRVHGCIFVVITHRKALLDICDIELKLEGGGKYSLTQLSNPT